MGVNAPGFKPASTPALLTLKERLGGVLTYQITKPPPGGYGQIIGADGTGNFAIIFLGDSDVCYIQAIEFLNQLKKQGYCIGNNAMFVPNDETFTGSAIQVIEIQGTYDG